jgi:hypothetical protein
MSKPQHQRTRKTAQVDEGDPLSESRRDSMRRQLLSGRRTPRAGFLPGAQHPYDEITIPGHVCEVCFDAPATRLQPAPGGGEMGVCEACAAPGAQKECRSC